MNNRIALVLKAKNISPSVLADDLGVQRSGISHILNGRNKPSLEFIQKLIKLYPDISIQWILFGEGPMMNPYPGTGSESATEVQQTVNNLEKPKPLIMDLFAIEHEGKQEISAPEEDITTGIGSQPIVNQKYTDIIQEEDLSVRKNAKDSIAENDSVQTEVAQLHVRQPHQTIPESNQSPEKNKKPDKPVRAVRRISKILVFYTDRTFVEYIPGEEED